MGKKMLLTAALVACAVLFFGTTASARWGSGPRGGAGCAWGNGGQANITADQWEKMDAERTAFQEKTRALRKNLWEKENALGTELGQEKVNQAKVETLQKDINALRLQFDKERLDHRARMQEICPAGGYGPNCPYGDGPRAGRGAGRGQGQGQGSGYGPGSGYGRGGCRW